jgi:hypothetical protein
MSSRASQSGTYSVGNNFSRRPGTISVSFKQPFTTPPIIHLTPLNDADNDDTFAVTLSQTTKTGFTAFIRRVSTNQEIQTWGQDLKVNWAAFERDDVYHGQIRVGTNLNHFDCVKTLLPMKFSTATGDVHVVITPHAHSRHKGDETFSSTVKEIRTKNRNVEIVTRRVCEDISKGWAQDLVLNYSFITKAQTAVGYSSTVNLGANKMKEEVRKTVAIPSKISSTFNSETPVILLAIRSDPLAPKDETFVASLRKIGSSSFDVVVRRTCYDMQTTWDQNLVIDCVIMAVDKPKKVNPPMSSIEQQFMKSVQVSESRYDRPSQYNGTAQTYQEQDYHEPTYHEEPYHAPNTAVPVYHDDYSYDYNAYDQTYQYQEPAVQPVQQPPVSYPSNYIAPPTSHQPSSYQQPAPRAQGHAQVYQDSYHEPSPPTRAIAPPRAQPTTYTQQYHGDSNYPTYNSNYDNNYTYPDTQTDYSHTEQDTHYEQTYDNHVYQDHYSAPQPTYTQPVPVPNRNPVQSSYGTSRTVVQPSVVTPSRPIIQNVQTIMKNPTTRQVQPNPYAQHRRQVTGVELVQKLKTLETSERKMNLVVAYMSNPSYAPLKDYEIGDVISHFPTSSEKELALNAIVTSDKLRTLDVLQTEDVLSQFDSNYKLSVLGEIAPKISDLVNADRLVNLFDTYDRNHARYLLGLTGY